MSKVPTFIFAAVAFAYAIAFPNIYSILGAGFWTALGVAEHVLGKHYKRLHAETAARKVELLAEREDIERRRLEAHAEFERDKALINSLRHKFNRDNN